MLDRKRVWKADFDMIGRLFYLFLMWAAYASAYPSVQYYSKAAGETYVAWVSLPITITVIVVAVSIMTWIGRELPSRPVRRPGPVVYSTRELIDEGRTFEERTLRKHLEDLLDRQDRDFT